MRIQEERERERESVCVRACVRARARVCVWNIESGKFLMPLLFASVSDEDATSENFF